MASISNKTVFRLNTGAEMPAFGFGTWQAPAQEVETAVEVALRSGYQLIDAAAIYRNETAVGSGIRNSGVARDQIFLISKLWNTRHHPQDVEPALDRTLRDLGTDYLDMYLMHWPDAFARSEKWFPQDEQGDILHDDIDPAVTWQAMEKLLTTGKVRAIGVCNFTIPRLDALLNKTTVVPAVNQVELHPFFQQRALIDWCGSKGIKMQAYSPLGNNQYGLQRAIDDPRICALATSLSLTPAQLVYSWGVQRGYCVLAKSVTQERILSNLNIQTLPDSAMQVLAGLDRNTRYNFPVNWGIDIFSEWDTQELKRAAAEKRDLNKRKFDI